ncbi:MAG: hypothetical protein H7281_12905 [Bacteriovorax sp.]|nr:hypothetical protein [Bacteriovorax sp.]
MKTVNLKEKLAASRCPNFVHLSLFTIFSLLSVSAFSLEHKVVSSRTPASAFDEEVLTVPLEQKVMAQSIFAEDDAGVMKGMRDTLNTWQDTEDYAQKWDLRSTHLYKTPTTQEKTKFISKNLLRYADKRLAGEVRDAEEGSALHTVGKVEKSLRPNASVPVSKYISLKFKVRVLQGKAIMDVRNPWFECNATVGANGKTKVLTKKDFNQLGTSTGVEYNVNEAQFVAFVDQEITKNIKARLSSTTMPNGNDADNRVEMTASFPFNL